MCINSCYMYMYVVQIIEHSFISPSYAATKATMAVSSVVQSPLRFYTVLEDRPYRSPAKRFAPEPAYDDSVEIVTAANATCTRLGQNHDSDMLQLVALLHTIPKKASATILERYQLYEVVLQVYSAVRQGKLPAGVHFASDVIKHRVYQMVFDVLYHQSAIEDMLIESGFYARHFDLHSHEQLVLIMAYDFQKEKFRLKLPRDSCNMIPGTVLRVAEALWQHKVKLGAAMARMRVKANAQHISQLIPEETRPMYERTLNQPCYARVNMVKVKNVQVEVLSKLHSDGFVVVKSRDHLALYQRSIYHLQRNLLECSPDCRLLLSDHELVTEGCLVVQDLVSYSFVDNIRDCIESSQGDVILTNCNAGMEAAHIATLIGDGHTVFAFGALPVQMKQLNQKILTLGLSNVQFIQAPFTSASPNDEILSGVGMVVCLPPSSLSAVSNPVDFVLQEGDQHLPALLGYPSKADSAKTLTVEQMELLTHALTFGQAKYVTYGTRSLHEAENGGVVKRALERHKAVVDQEGESHGMNRAIYTLRPSPADMEEESEHYIAVFERSSEKPGPSANEVIARAIAKGILDGEGITVQKHIKKPKGTTKKSRRVFSRYDGIPMTIAAKQKVVGKKQFHDSHRKPFV